MTIFVRMMITLCIYKDLSGYSYAKILSLINFRFQIKKKSFIHSYKLVQKLLYLWACETSKMKGVMHGTVLLLSYQRRGD